MANRLREIREERGLSLRQLGEKSGIGFTILGKIEKGQVRLASHHLEKLAPALGCKPEDLVTERPLRDVDRAFLELIQELPDADIQVLIDMAERLRS